MEIHYLGAIQLFVLKLLIELIGKSCRNDSTPIGRSMVYIRGNLPLVYAKTLAPISAIPFITLS